MQRKSLEELKEISAGDDELYQLEDAADELRKMEDVEKVRKEMEKGQEKLMNQKMFRAI